MTGNDLKDWRKGLNISQEHLARILDISVSTVARWEQLNDNDLPNGKILEFALLGVEKTLKELNEKSVKN